jgi:hypothetical protein
MHESVNGTSRYFRRATAWVAIGAWRTLTDLLPLSSPARKNISVRARPKSLLDSRHPGPHQGAFRDRHERRARDAVDVGGAFDESADADGEVVWS